MVPVYGAAERSGIDIVGLKSRYFPKKPTAIYGDDQRLLGSMLWPLIRCLPELKTPIGDANKNLNAVRAEAERLRNCPCTLIR
jgi:hypothetical protein